MSRPYRRPIPIYHYRSRPSWWLHLGTAIGGAIIVGLFTFALWWLLSAWVRWMGGAA